MGRRTFISKRGKIISWEEPYSNAPIPPEIQNQIDYEGSNIFTNYLFNVGIGGDYQEAVLDIINTLPPDPTPGARYLYIGDGDLHNSIITFDYVEYPIGQAPIGHWVSIPSEIGMNVWVISKGTFYTYKDAVWKENASLEDIVEIINRSHNDWPDRDVESCHPASSIEISHLAYSDLQMLINTIHSSGIVSGGEVSDNGDGTIKVKAGSGFIRSSDPISSVLYFEWDELLSLSITENEINYVYIDYNNGTPIILSTNNINILNCKDKYPISRVYRIGTELHILDCGLQSLDISGRDQHRLIEVKGFSDRVSGLVTCELDERYINISEGLVYCGLIRIIIPEFNSFTGNTFTYQYRDGLGGWTRVIGCSQIDNLQYDDGSGTLAPLSSDKYGIHWVYIDQNGHVEIVYGCNEYTLIEAGLKNPPTEILPMISAIYTLVAKVIIKQGEIHTTSIENPFVIPFTTSVIYNHNELGNIQGGSSSERYHLTNAQVGNLTSAYNHTLSDGKSHSDVVLNNTHRTSDGKDHSDVVLNNTHRVDINNPHSVTKTQVGLSDVPNLNTTDAVNHISSDGKSHSDVVLNNAHRASTSNPHQTTLEQARSQGNTISGNINANNNTITSLKTPIDPNDAANKAYVDSHVVADANYRLVRGLVLSFVSLSQITVGTGLCIDSTNVVLINVNSPLTVDITVVGVNGRDAGVEAANTWYYAYVISKVDGTVAGLLSTSSTSPVLPSGYVYFRRIGVVRNNATSNFLNFRQVGVVDKTYYYIEEIDTTLTILSSGTSLSWSDVDCSSLVPSTSNVCYLNVAEVGNGGVFCSLRVNNTIPTIRKVYKRESVECSMILDSNQIFEYEVDLVGAKLNICVLGFLDSI